MRGRLDEMSRGEGERMRGRLDEMRGERMRGRLDEMRRREDERKTR